MALDAGEITFCNKVLGHLGEDTIAAADTTTKAYIQCELYLDDMLDYITGSHPWNRGKARAMLIQSLTDDPLFGYQYAYTKPSAALRIWKPSSWKYKYNVEEGSAGNEVIVTDEGGLPAEWLTATAYVVGFVVRNGTNDTAFECILAHTAGDDDEEPGVGANTATYWTSKGDGLFILDVEYIKQLTVANLPWYMKKPCQIALASDIATAIKDDGGKISDNLLKRLHGTELPLARHYDAQESARESIETSFWLDSRGTNSSGTNLTV